MNFSDHQNAAAAWGGSVASIHSSEEYNYILKKANSAMYTDVGCFFGRCVGWFLGGKRKEGSDAYDGGADAWEWLDGSPWDFAKWASTIHGDEPNNDEGQIEDAIVFCFNGWDWVDLASKKLQGAVYKKASLFD